MFLGNKRYSLEKNKNIITRNPVTIVKTRVYARVHYVSETGKNSWKSKISMTQIFHYDVPDRGTKPISIPKPHESLVINTFDRVVR